MTKTVIEHELRLGCAAKRYPDLFTSLEIVDILQTIDSSQRDARRAVAPGKFALWSGRISCWPDAIVRPVIGCRHEGASFIAIAAAAAPPKRLSPLQDASFNKDNAIPGAPCEKQVNGWLDSTLVFQPTPTR